MIAIADQFTTCGNAAMSAVQELVDKCHISSIGQSSDAFVNDIVANFDASAIMAEAKKLGLTK